MIIPYIGVIIIQTIIIITFILSININNSITKKINNNLDIIVFISYFLIIICTISITAMTYNNKKNDTITIHNKKNDTITIYIQKIKSNQYEIKIKDGNYVQKND